jgi:hypothetical protein
LTGLKYALSTWERNTMAWWETTLNVDIFYETVNLSKLLDMVMDVREMNAIGDNVFDCVIDKGCLDSILVTFAYLNLLTHLVWIKFNCKC